MINNDASLSFAVIVPTLNPGPIWAEWLDSLLLSNGVERENVLIIDSNSSDNTLSISKRHGVHVKQISRSEFDHGGTRQLALQSFPDAEIIVFLTQDAVLEGAASIEMLCGTFDDPAVGAAYGRQLPHPDAKPLGAHARLFNYNDKSYTRCREDIPKFGIKTAFISNSFAAYRVTALDEVGGFPRDVILGEDACVAARMLMKDWSVAYCAEARVYHSHDYTIFEEFRRYFDIGVFHAREHWLLDEFGKPEGEGGRFIRSEMRYLWHNAPGLLPEAIARTFFKYFGYRLGRIEQRLPVAVKRLLSMHRRYWA
ncbi:MAG: glycosyltransferase [Pseudomonadota bacterium]